MTRTKRPTVTLRCPVNQYASPNERIVEFSFPDGTGGLIAFRTVGPYSYNTVDIYRIDDGILVRLPDDGASGPNGDVR